MISRVIARSVRCASYFGTLFEIKEQAFQINRIKKLVVAWLLTNFGDLKIVSDLDDCSRPCASLLMLDDDFIFYYCRSNTLLMELLQNLLIMLQQTLMKKLQ
jgi:hypothetical protein